MQNLRIEGDRARMPPRLYGQGHEHERPKSRAGGRHRGASTVCGEKDAHPPPRRIGRAVAWEAIHWGSKGRDPDVIGFCHQTIMGSAVGKCDPETEGKFIEEKMNRRQLCCGGSV